MNLDQLMTLLHTTLIYSIKHILNVVRYFFSWIFKLKSNSLNTKMSLKCIDNLFICAILIVFIYRFIKEVPRVRWEQSLGSKIDSFIWTVLLLAPPYEAASSLHYSAFVVKPLLLGKQA